MNGRLGDCGKGSDVVNKDCSVYGDYGCGDSGNEDGGVVQERIERRRIVSSSTFLNSSASHRLLAAFQMDFADRVKGGDSAVVDGGCGLDDSGGGGISGSCGSGVVGCVTVGVLPVVAEARPHWQQHWLLLLDVAAAVADVGRQQLNIIQKYDQ